jgi:DNA-binding IclR family transcriptional regulator
MSTKRTHENVQPVDEMTTPASVEGPRGAPSEEVGNRTLRRGLQVLDQVLAAGREGVRVVDLCRATGLERATLYRLLAPLIDAGYVARQGRYRYQPGLRLAPLQPQPGSANWAVRLEPVLAQVSASGGDATFAIVREGALSRCIARHVGTHPVQILVIQVGTAQPLGVGAAGLALLAALPEAEVDACIAANAGQLPAYGGMSPERLRLLVAASRERGWSVVGNHATRGVLAVGCAVRNALGEPVAGISVATTLARLPKARQQLMARVMQEALQQHLPAGL